MLNIIGKSPEYRRKFVRISLKCSEQNVCWTSRISLESHRNV
ncbi:hypothetical protein CsSME_00040907 [Camellia sinensis var. sinensis]